MRILPALLPVVALSAGVGLGLVVLLPGGGDVALDDAAPAHAPADVVPHQGARQDAATRPEGTVLSGRSTTDPGSPWVVVNKTHPIEPLDYRPAVDLVRGYQVATVAAAPLTRLLGASDRAGLGFKIASAFRSYDYQRTVHDATVAARGLAEADRVSARPGHSEHQTGLAVDLVTPGDPACDFDPCFAGTPGGRWLDRSSWRFGFIVRYRAGDEDVTGYQPEPWHLRYVGRRLAAALHRTGTTTLEEYFAIPGGDYPSGHSGGGGGVGER